MSLIIPPSSDGGLTVDVTIAAQDADLDVNVTNTSINVNSTIVGQSVDVEVNSTIVGQSVDVDVNVTNMPVPVVEIPRGHVVGSTQISAFGESVISGAVTKQVLWSNGAYVLPPATGQQMSIVSTSTQDDNSTGTGLWSIKIFYLDDALVPQTETVILDGTTVVTTVATDIRFIYKVVAVTYGTNKKAVGNISVYNGANTYAYISIGNLVDKSSVYMVPAGKRLMITGLAAGASSGSADASVIVYVAVSSYAGEDYSDDSLFIPLAGIAVQDSSSSLSLPVPIAIEAGTVFCMLVTSDKAATIVGSWFGWLENV